MDRHLFDGYVSRMTEIRKLSSPSLDGIPNADAYSDVLREDFIKIGKLAGENRALIENELSPLFHSDSVLSDDQVEEMMRFGDQLIYAEECENLDLPVMSLLSDRLVRDAEEKQDICNLIRQLDAEISTCYALMNMTGRVSAYPEISKRYRDKGLAIGEFFLSRLDKEKFRAIQDPECMAMVLTNARYSVVFYEHTTDNPEANCRNLEILETMLSVANDPFYHEMVPGFDWTYFLYRTLEYYASNTVYRNARNFTRSQLNTICDRSEELRALWANHLDYFSDLDIKDNIELLVLRNQFLAGRISEAVYRHRLLELYHHRDSQDYAVSGLMSNLLYPLEYIYLLDPTHLTSSEKNILKTIYQDITAYVFRMPDSGVFSFLLEYFTGIINHFIEVPSGIDFEDMVLRCLAVLHPPTYVHSLMVGQITECLCGHLINRRPELLIGICGCQSKEEVWEHRGEILSFAYHSALCHDFGKISIIDTIFVYGRKLLDMEFNIIKTHPRTGYDLLSRHESTRAYGEIALGHHKWYDGTRGYPDDFDLSQSTVKAIIDLVHCADCMDAATDTIGRSYKNGKTLSQFMNELREGSGTCYAPWLAELMSDEIVQQDISYLLTTGRHRNYRDTYLLLLGVQQSVG